MKIRILPSKTDGLLQVATSDLAFVAEVVPDTCAEVRET